ncbi:MAG: 4a-hydroxytetrahydrobiopterin dehydratase [Bacteroidia bacterium]|nr:4a-hydroxytetrahydrobiopterin dehydratase [Bacteroidia bacterium]
MLKSLFFNEVEIRERLTFLPDWQYLDGKLYRKLVFSDFIRAMSFCMAVALEAERQNHHPTWRNSYDIVEIWLCTHEPASGITESDFKLANAIESYVFHFR